MHGMIPTDFIVTQALILRRVSIVIETRPELVLQRSSRKCNLVSVSEELVSCVHL